jgi:hypothetical protein
MIMSKTLAASCFAIVMLAPAGNDAWPQTTRTIKLVVAIAQLIDWFTVALQTPMVTGSLEKLGLISVRNCGSQFADYLRKRYDEYGRIIREAHIKAR